jgi:hypothetical protein
LVNAAALAQIPLSSCYGIDVDEIKIQKAHTFVKIASEELEAKLGIKTGGTPAMWSRCSSKLKVSSRLTSCQTGSGC